MTKQGRDTSLPEVNGIESADLTAIERCLGEPNRLNGRFGSLWALELLMRTVRRLPKIPVAWCGAYFASVIERAYLELGVRFERAGHVFTTAPDQRLDRLRHAWLSSHERATAPPRVSH